MKVHYINILLFTVPLNILVNTYKKKPSITSHTQTNRSLCECEMYMQNYDNDPQMKRVMQQFEDRASQRFEEYNERLQTKRMECKNRCDKEIEKIILKDKLEKQMEQQLTTLETKINTDDIPTCICEKSLADKTEKFCLNCGKTMGGFAPGYCLVSVLWYAAWTNYVPIAVAKAAMDAGMEVVRFGLKTLGAEKLIPVICKKISSINDFNKVTTFAEIIQTQFEASCRLSSTGAIKPLGTDICTNVINGPTGGPAAQKVVSKALELIVDKAPGTAKAAERIEAAKYASTSSSLTTGITASILAIEVIVLIMMIIYWILRYRRKKKMKKKLQYIKLLEE
ncbi:rifin PIR protein, putative [Plasmodium reichenowi]|uniref:Rifin PIR protein, putative n=1 Tax=Plasmodium reichenowi TaxID=5854 RepID=A0A2P9DCG0_PLARE|nr:rifin PIR protein, putative [Plasmodium reichenowi]